MGVHSKKQKSMARFLFVLDLIFAITFLTFFNMLYPLVKIQKLLLKIDTKNRNFAYVFCYHYFLSDETTCIREFAGMKKINFACIF